MKKGRKITGCYISPDKVKVTSSTGEKLQEGQRVLLCQPTNNVIVDYATGKVIGRKEKVLGTGIVKGKEGSFIVNIAGRGPALLGSRRPDKVAKAIEDMAKIKAPTGRLKFNERSSGRHVIIKVIEE